MTPIETKMEFEAYNEHVKNEMMRDVALAWHMAAYQRARHLPSLEGQLNRIRHKDKKLLSQELKAALGFNQWKKDSAKPMSK